MAREPREVPSGPGHGAGAGPLRGTDGPDRYGVFPDGGAGS